MKGFVYFLIHGWTGEVSGFCYVYSSTVDMNNKKFAASLLKCMGMDEG